MNPTLQGYAAAVLEAADSASLRRIADDLATIERQAVSNAPLRAALTDTSVPGRVRRAVMLELLDGKVAGEARRLAAFACLVVPAPEVPAALGWLASRAWHEAEGRETEEPPLSLTQARARVAGYATALHEDMTYQQLESLEDDLFRFGRIVASTPPLRAALTDRDLDVAARQGLVSELLEGKVPATTLALVRYVVAGGRARDFVGTTDFLVEQTAAARGWRIAHVRAAAPIGDAQQSMLRDSLAGLAGQPVELQLVIDETLLGGARIRIGDLLVDATARGRLDALREHLVPAGWQQTEFGRAGREHTTTADTEGAN
ncbi:MAG TPA: F0F1 ATP synthase subunit delta [Acidimicrobiales bacterium]|nr:F0F1 ATP synthase subunit delta [Acidimicrobiales bacterium]